MILFAYTVSRIARLLIVEWIINWRTVLLTYRFSYGPFESGLRSFSGCRLRTLPRLGIARCINGLRSLYPINLGGPDPLVVNVGLYGRLDLILEHFNFWVGPLLERAHHLQLLLHLVQFFQLLQGLQKFEILLGPCQIWDHHSSVYCSLYLFY